jgi:translation initiation factor IF-3
VFNKKGGPPQKKSFTRVNEQIRISPVLVVKDGRNLGIMSNYEALRMARDEGLDLVEVSPNSRPPVCSIVDYGKFKFDQSKKKKKEKSGNLQKEKEVSFRYIIDDHDLETKVNQIKSWLDSGERVKVTVKFKGRENAHKDEGMVVINKCLDLLKEVATVEKKPSFEGNQIVARLTKNKIYEQ